jgi:hypothetical protein
MGNAVLASHNKESSDTELDEMGAPIVTPHEITESPIGRPNPFLDHGCMDKQPISNHKEISENRWKSRYFILKRGALLYYHVIHTQSYDMSSVIGVELGRVLFFFLTSKICI